MCSEYVLMMIIHLRSHFYFISFHLFGSIFVFRLFFQLLLVPFLRSLLDRSQNVQFLDGLPVGQMKCLRFDVFYVHKIKTCSFNWNFRIFGVVAGRASWRQRASEGERERKKDVDKDRLDIVAFSLRCLDIHHTRIHSNSSELFEEWMPWYLHW